MTGFAIWIYALLLPTFAAGGLIGPSVLERDGPLDVLWVSVQGWVGLSSLSPSARGALLAVGGNLLVLVTLSLLARSSLRERMAATAFVRPAVHQAPGRSVGSPRVGDVLAIAERIVGIGRGAGRAARVHRRRWCFHRRSRPIPPIAASCSTWSACSPARSARPPRA